MRTAVVTKTARFLALLTATAALAAPVVAGPGKGGGGGGPTSGITFSVEVADDTSFSSGANLWVPLDTDGSPCLGWSAGTSGAKPDYYARWRVDGVHLECQDLTTSTRAQLTDDIVVKVSLNSDGKIFRIQVTGQDVIGTEGLWHRSDPIDVAPTDPLPGGFTIHVHAMGVQLWKCDTHLLKKQTKCDVDAGTFSIDDMIYTPNSTSTSIESTIRYVPRDGPH